MDGPTWYSILGVDHDASDADIKKAYRTASRATHPDTTGSSNTSMFDAVQKAYDTLSDPSARAAYDRRINGEPARSAPNPQPSYTRTTPPPASPPTDPVYDQPSEPREEFDENAYRAHRRMRKATGTVIVLCALLLAVGICMVHAYRYDASGYADAMMTIFYVTLIVHGFFAFSLWKGGGWDYSPFLKESLVGPGIIFLFTFDLEERGLSSVPTAVGWLMALASITIAAVWLTYRRRTTRQWTFPGAL